MGRVKKDQEEKHSLEQRVKSEYREMPGLLLSDSQAIRLLNIEPETWQSVSSKLLETGFLKRTPKGYVKSEET